MAPFSLSVKIMAEVNVNKASLNGTRKPTGKGRRLGGSSGTGLKRMAKHGIQQVSGGFKPFMERSFAKVKSSVKKVAVDLLEMAAMGVVVMYPAGLPLPVEVGLGLALSVVKGTSEIHSNPSGEHGSVCPVKHPSGVHGSVCPVTNPSKEYGRDRKGWKPSKEYGRDRKGWKPSEEYGRDRKGWKPNEEYERAGKEGWKPSEESSRYLKAERN